MPENMRLAGEGEIHNSRPVCVISCPEVHLFVSSALYYAAELTQDFEVHVVFYTLGEKKLSQAERHVMAELGIEIHWVNPQGVLRKHFVFRRVVKKLINEKDTKALLLVDDITLINNYFGRAAIKRGIPIICFQPGVVFFRSFRKQFLRELIYGRNKRAEELRQKRLPAFLAKFIARYEPYLRHFFDYWGGPALTGAMPFPGKSSLYLRKGILCMRYGEKLLVYQDEAIPVFVEGGVPEKAIVKIAYPLSRDVGRKLYDRIYTPVNADRPTILIMFSIPFTNGTDDVEGRTANRLHKLVSNLCNRYPNHQILLKPHPSLVSDQQKPIGRMIMDIEARFQNFESLRPEVNATKFLAQAAIIISNPSNIVEIARYLGGMVLVVTHFLEPSLFTHMNMQGIHFYPSSEDLEEVDIAALEPCVAIAAQEEKDLDIPIQRVIETIINEPR